MPDLNAFKVESAMRMVAGTARSMGIESNRRLLLGKTNHFDIMAKLTKNQKKALSKYAAKEYS